jgi:hypothetical protein
MKKGFEKLLIVATVTELKLFTIKRGDRDNKIGLIDTELSISTDKQLISKIVQLNKNGRVFYGGSEGHVNELKFEDTYLNLLSIFAQDKRKLKRNDL